MLENIFGSRAAERTLLYLECYGEGYPRGIARTYDMSVSQIHKQLTKFEEAGILVRREFGRTCLYQWNPRNPLVNPLRELLRQALETLPKADIERYYRQRRRPRHRGKPIRTT